MDQFDHLKATLKETNPCKKDWTKDYSRRMQKKGENIRIDDLIEGAPVEVKNHLLEKDEKGSTSQNDQINRQKGFFSWIGDLIALDPEEQAFRVKVDEDLVEQTENHIKLIRESNNDIINKAIAGDVELQQIKVANKASEFLGNKEEISKKFRARYIQAYEGVYTPEKRKEDHAFIQEYSPRLDWKEQARTIEGYAKGAHETTVAKALDKLDPGDRYMRFQGSLYNRMRMERIRWWIGNS